MSLICGVNGDDNERNIKTSLDSSNRFIFHFARVLWLRPPFLLSSSCHPLILTSPPPPPLLFFSSFSSTPSFPNLTSKDAAEISSPAVEIKTVDSNLKFLRGMCVIKSLLCNCGGWLTITVAGVGFFFLLSRLLEQTPNLQY